MPREPLTEVEHHLIESAEQGTAAWLAQRIGVTASVSHDVLTDAGITRRVLSMLDGTSFSSNDATRYGTLAEEPTRQLFNTIIGRMLAIVQGRDPSDIQTEVIERGAIAHPHYPFIRASVDGDVIDHASKRWWLVEFKAPYTQIFYLRKQDGVPDVKRTKPSYYSQCIYQMGVRREHPYFTPGDDYKWRDMNHFAVATPTGMCIERVPFDHDHWKSLVTGATAAADLYDEVLPLRLSGVLPPGCIRPVMRISTSTPVSKLAQSRSCSKQEEEEGGSGDEDRDDEYDGEERGYLLAECDTDYAALSAPDISVADYHRLLFLLLKNESRLHKQLQPLLCAALANDDEEFDKLVAERRSIGLRELPPCPK